MLINLILINFTIRILRSNVYKIRTPLFTQSFPASCQLHRAEFLLIQAIPPIVLTQKFHYYIHKSSPPVPSPCKMLHNVVNDYGWEYPAEHLTFKMEGHPLSDVRACFSIYSQLPSISAGRSSIRNLRTFQANQTCHIRCKVVKLCRGWRGEIFTLKAIRQI